MYKKSPFPLYFYFFSRVKEGRKRDISPTFPLPPCLLHQIDGHVEDRGEEKEEEEEERGGKRRKEDRKLISSHSLLRSVQHSSACQKKKGGEREGDLRDCAHRTPHAFSHTKKKSVLLLVRGGRDSALRSNAGKKGEGLGEEGRALSLPPFFSV